MRFTIGTDEAEARAEFERFKRDALPAIVSDWEAAQGAVRAKPKDSIGGLFEWYTESAMRVRGTGEREIRAVNYQFSDFRSDQSWQVLVYFL